MEVKGNSGSANYTAEGDRAGSCAITAGDMGPVRTQKQPLALSAGHRGG